MPRKRPQLSLTAHERMAIERALAEAGGVIAAIALLKTTRTTMYRRMRVLGVAADARHRISPFDPVVATGERVSFLGYERAAIVHALDDAGGSVDKAAKLLRMGRATLYRKIARFGVGTA